MQHRYFITSTGTGMGKSFITAAMVQQAKALKRTVMAYKPVISGFDPANVASSDTGLILASLGLPPTAENIERLSPYRYAEPLAPSMAARLEKRPLDFDALIAHGRKTLQSDDEVVLIEGVGGAMVPLNERHTVLDWIAALGIPALLVTGTYLGSISHTLTALAALKQADVRIATIIVNQSEDASVPLNATLDELRYWTETPLLPVTRRADGNWRDVTELQIFLKD
jgi:dethiobiotin synthetase